MGWGETQGSTSQERALQEAERLAAAVRTWLLTPTTGNTEAVRSRLRAFDRELRRVG